MKYKGTKKLRLSEKKTKLLKFSLATMLLFFSFYGHSQRSSSQTIKPTFDFAKTETELVQLFEVLAKGENEHVRYNANEKFLKLLKSTLAENGAFNYPFENLRCEKLMPPDKKFRLFNWMVRRDQGMEFFAVLMVHNERTKEYQIIQLVDESDAIFDLPNAVLDKDNWFGAYYTQLVQTEASGRKYYTLLGWSGNNQTISRRLIEILTFKPNGDPVFGADLFVGLKGRKERFKRHIFEYSRKGTMILRYDFQSYSEPTGTPKPGQKQKEKLIKANMIVFDRLVPSNPDLISQREAYVAAGGTYDAYVWLNGRWTLKTDIKAQNSNPPNTKNRNRNRPNPPPVIYQSVFDF